MGDDDGTPRNSTNQPVHFLRDEEEDNGEDEDNGEHTAGGSCQDPKQPGRKRKRSKAWSTFQLLPTANDDESLKAQFVFDPRYKTQFVEFSYKLLYGKDNVQIVELQETLRALFDLYKDTIPTYTAVSKDVSGGSLQSEGADVMKEFDAFDIDLLNVADKTELDKYLEETRLNRNLEVDILDYWKTNQYRYPNLALMARDVLSISISTVASESAFSVGGRVLDQYRSCLAHNVVESLICTHDWRFNVEVVPEYTWEDLTEDIMSVGLDEDSHSTQYSNVSTSNSNVK